MKGGEKMTMATVKKEKQRHSLVIKPAIRPEERHKIEDALKNLGYKISGGGTATNMSECDISFEK